MVEKIVWDKIYPSNDIFKFKNKIDQILFAIPSLTRDQSKLILEDLKSYKIPVLKVPSFESN